MGTGLQNTRRPQLRPRLLHCSTPAITYHILLQKAAADDPSALPLTDFLSYFAHTQMLPLSPPATPSPDQWAPNAAALQTLVDKFGHRLSAKQRNRILAHNAELGDAAAQFKLGTSDALEQDEVCHPTALAVILGWL